RQRTADGSRARTRADGATKCPEEFFGHAPRAPRDASSTRRSAVAVSLQPRRPGCIAGYDGAFGPAASDRAKPMTETEARNALLVRACELAPAGVVNWHDDDRAWASRAA